MKKIIVSMIAMLFLTRLAVATDYTVDFSRMDNLETIRPLVEGCEDFDAMELYRDRMTSTKDLETMRRTLSAIGLGMFIRCPDGISGQGITPVKKVTSTEPPDYSVDFTLVEDFETIRPLVKGCAEFGALENFRNRLEKTANLNDMRDTLVGIGFGMFDKCPDGISGQGISRPER
jgi:hypothetical protein